MIHHPSVHKYSTFFQGATWPGGYDFPLIVMRARISSNDEGENFQTNPFLPGNGMHTQICKSSLPQGRGLSTLTLFVQYIFYQRARSDHLMDYVMGNAAGARNYNSQTGWHYNLAGTYFLVEDLQRKGLQEGDATSHSEHLTCYLCIIQNIQRPRCWLAPSDAIVSFFQLLG